MTRRTCTGRRAPEDPSGGALGRGACLRRRIKAGLPVVGSALTIAEPFTTEVMGRAGFDFLMIDSEHSPITASELQTMLIALQTSASAVLVRVTENRHHPIMQALDLGADGVVVPHVDTAQECAAAVDSAKYPPDGHRGFGPRRAKRLVADSSYERTANDVLVIPMIESVAAVENIDQIGVTPGVDGVFVGPSDLAVSLKSGDADVVDAQARAVFAACRRHGIAPGIIPNTNGDTAAWIRAGAQMVTIGSDLRFLDAGIAAALEERARALNG
jgi:2-keto-3-deoxy-L-rhamnonate aldolase RhmA